MATTTRTSKKATADPVADEPIPGQLGIDDVADGEQPIDPAADAPATDAPTASTWTEPPADPPVPVPGGWVGVLATLGRRDGVGRVLSEPEPGQPALPPLPLPLYAVCPDGPQAPVQVGTVERIWIDDAVPGELTLRGSGRFDLAVPGGYAAAKLLTGPAPVAVRLNVAEEDVNSVGGYLRTWTPESVCLLGGRAVDEQALIAGVW